MTVGAREAHRRHHRFGAGVGESETIEAGGLREERGNFTYDIGAHADFDGLMKCCLDRRLYDRRTMS